MSKPRVTTADAKEIVTDFRRFDAQEWLRLKAECLRAPLVEVPGRPREMRRKAPEDESGDAFLDAFEEKFGLKAGPAVSENWVSAKELRRRLVNF